MMLVVDASIAIKWVVAEDGSDVAVGLRRPTTAFLAPDLLTIECANILWKKARRAELTPEEAKLGFADLTGLSPPDARDKISKVAEEQDAEESALVATGLSPREARARVRQRGRDAIPDETDVIELAALWSIDPTQLSNQGHPFGLGLAARLPKNAMQ